MQRSQTPCSSSDVWCNQHFHHPPPDGVMVTLKMMTLIALMENFRTDAAQLDEIGLFVS